MKTVFERSPDFRIKRFTSIALPAYSYIPGKHPHPIRDSAGHSYGREQPICTLKTSGNLEMERLYLEGIDLFNCGYYWEAHEEWEAVWHALGRKTNAAKFVQGLIKLAAAGVKVLEGKSNGVRRHGVRAAELFKESAEDDLKEIFGGFRVSDLVEFADWVQDQHQMESVTDDDIDSTEVRIVFPFVLSPIIG